MCPCLAVVRLAVDFCMHTSNWSLSYWSLEGPMVSHSQPAQYKTRHITHDVIAHVAVVTS